MGSKISIGLVYENKCREDISVYLEKVINGFLDKGYIKDFTVSLDNEGNEWIEQNVGEKEVTKTDYDLITTNYYGKINLISNIITSNPKKITVAIEKSDEYFGFLVDLNEEDLTKNFSLDELENKIVDFLLSKFRILNYDYAFCDNEAEIEYSPQEIKQEEELYSLLFIPNTKENKKEIEVKKSSWYIDGLTSR